MSREQANTFKKYREADDPQGNIAWAVRLQNKALRQGPEAAKRIDVEGVFELQEEEKIIWRLLRLPRKYLDLEHAGVVPIARLRAVLRGFVAADVVDIVETDDAKALLPTEVKRMRAEIAGKELPPTKELRGRVFRPGIDKKPEPAAQPIAELAPAPAPLAVPKAVTLGDEDRIYKQEIERAHAAIGKQTLYEFLSVPRPTDDSTVRAAYMRLAREYHPDRVAGGALSDDESLKQKIDALFKKLGEAQATLANAELRATYDRKLDALGESRGMSADGKKQRRPLEAKNAFTMAETFFKRRDYQQAEAHYRQAANFDGEDAKILTGLAYCIWLNPEHEESKRTADARKRLSEIVTLYKHGDAAYRLGLVLRKANDEAGAQRQFATAHKLDPAHTEAGREVRLTDMRHKKSVDGKKDTSFLGKLGLKK